MECRRSRILNSKECMEVRVGLRSIVFFEVTMGSGVNHHVVQFNLLRHRGT